MEHINPIMEAIKFILNSSETNEVKLIKLNEIIPNLNPGDHSRELIFLCEKAVFLAVDGQHFDLAAQLCLIKAKTEIGECGHKIVLKNNFKFAIDWFEFALEEEEKEYKKLDKEIKESWDKSQKSINLGYELVKKKPFTGAVASCYRTSGEIYGQYYLQLRLYYFCPTGTWRAKISNLKISRWLDLDDLLFINKKDKVHLKKVKMECLSSLKNAMILFKQENLYEEIASTYLTFGLEYHSFNSPIRFIYCKWRAKMLIKKYNIKTPVILSHLKNLEKSPLIGSWRDEI